MYHLFTNVSPVIQKSSLWTPTVSAPGPFFFFQCHPYPPTPPPPPLPPLKEKIIKIKTLLTPQVVKGSMSALVEKLKTERKEGEGNSGLKETLSRLFYNWAVSVCTWEPVSPLIPCNPAAPSWPFGKKKGHKSKWWLTPDFHRNTVKLSEIPVMQ